MRDGAPPADAGRNPEMKAASEGESRGYWRSVWKHYRRHPSGVVGLVVFTILLAVGLGAHLLAGGLPIACKYEGKVSFPAVVATFHKIPGAKSIWPMPKPFRFPQFTAKESLPEDKEGWAIWPLVPWDPNEVDPIRKLEPPGKEHLLGTDDVGRDVLARLIHATSIAMLVGFISMGIATAIGLPLGALAGFHGGGMDIGVSR